MATKVQDMVHETFDAFIYADADRARHAIDMDDEVDELYHQVIRTVLEVASGNDEVYPQTVHVQGVAKLLERIGDHATNVAEQVIFMVDGTDIRHEGTAPRRLMRRSGGARPHGESSYKDEQQQHRRMCSIDGGAALKPKTLIQTHPNGVIVSRLGRFDCVEDGPMERFPS